MDDGGRAPALLSWLSHNTSTRRSQRAQEPDERCVTPLKKYHMISPIASNRDYVGYVAPIILLNPSTTCSTTLETLRATHKTSVFAMPFLEKNRKKQKKHQEVKCSSQTNAPLERRRGRTNGSCALLGRSTEILDPIPRFGAPRGSMEMEVICFTTWAPHAAPSRTMRRCVNRTMPAVPRKPAPERSDRSPQPWLGLVDFS